MSEVGFFTPVSFGNQPKVGTQLFLETVDSYFYLGGKKAYVILGHTQSGAREAVLSEDSPPCLITTLKVISYFTIVLPVVMLIAKVVLRSMHTFHLIDAKQKLEKEIEISQATIQRIQALMPKIQRRQDDPEITWHDSSNNLVFSLDSVQGLVFKMALPMVRILRNGVSLDSHQRSEERFANMVKAAEVCLAHQLGLLVIPRAKKFNVAGMTLIAEERLNINQDETAQEHFYQLSSLNETARQLAVFIAKTGFSDVEWRNIPLVDTAQEFQGNRRVALVDLEEMGDASVGLFGRNDAFQGFRRGLIRCLSSEKQIDIAINEAQRYGVISQNVAQIKAKRVEEIRIDRQMEQFYAQNGVSKDSRKPIQVGNLASLGLDLEEQAMGRTGRKIRTGTSNGSEFMWEIEPVTMRKAITDVISAINKGISETPETASLKGKRYIQLKHNSGKEEDFFLKEYDRLGCPRNQEYASDHDDGLNQRWLKRIINALVAQNHIFKLDKITAHGYFVQV